MSEHQQEVFRRYYEAKIKQLENTLERLNILEHAVEITAICRKVIAIKQLLGTMQEPPGGNKSIKGVQGFRISPGKILKRRDSSN